MDVLASQLAFSGESYRRRFSAEAIRRLAPEADPAGEAATLGRALHRTIDLAFHVSQAVHTHSGLAIAEPYRKLGPFALERLR
jgi:hypothetical protein